MFTELLNQKITGGVLQQEVDKMTGIIEANGVNKWVPSGESRIENEVDKFFRIGDGLTLAEIKAKKTEAGFKNQWEAKWKGNTVDKRNKLTKTAPIVKAGVVNGAPKKKPAANAEPMKPLF